MNELTNLISDRSQKVMMMTNNIFAEDKASFQALHLTANENVLSDLARSVLSSHFSQRYHLGMHDDREVDQSTTMLGNLMFRGMPAVYELEKLAVISAQEMFLAKALDFRLLSGLHATIALVATMTRPGDWIYTIPPEFGGHAATKNIIESLGRRCFFIPWNKEQYDVDLEGLANALKKYPSAIIFDYGDPLFELSLSGIRKIVGSEVILAYDCSHTHGLIAGKNFQNPLQEGFDVLFGNTHKTFPGPQKAAIYFKEQNFGQQISKKIGESMLSSQHTHQSIALYITMLEMFEFGQNYAQQIVKNARALASALTLIGFNVFKFKQEYTATHIVLIEYPSQTLSFEACEKLHRHNISTNTRSLYSKYFIRLGVQEITRLGMVEQDMIYIAELIHEILSVKGISEQLRGKVLDFKKRYLEVKFSFDGIFQMKN